MPYESPNFIVYQDLLSLSVRPLFSSEMTADNASCDAFQGKFLQKLLSQLPDFSFEKNVCAGTRGILCTLASSFFLLRNYDFNTCSAPSSGDNVPGGDVVKLESPLCVLCHGKDSLFLSAHFELVFVNFCDDSTFPPRLFLCIPCVGNGVCCIMFVKMYRCSVEALCG